MCNPIKLYLVITSVSELRDQIRKARLEEDKAVNHLQRVKNRNEQLEAEMNLLKDQGMYAVESTQNLETTQGGENSNGKDIIIQTN